MLLTTLTLSALLSLQDAQLDTNRPHRSFRFVYTAAVPTVPGGAKQVRLWIPAPLDTPDQTQSKELQQLEGVERRPDGQPQLEPARTRAAHPGPPTQLGRRAGIHLANGVVELAHAGEP